MPCPTESLELYAVNMQFYNCYMLLFDFVDLNRYEFIKSLDVAMEWIDVELERFHGMLHIPAERRIGAYVDLKRRLANLKSTRDSCVGRMFRPPI